MRSQLKDMRSVTRLALVLVLLLVGLVPGGTYAAFAQETPAAQPTPTAQEAVAATQGTPTAAAPQIATDSATSRQPHTRHPEAVKAIAQIKSPYCPGLMLDVCTSSQGYALRDSIDDMAYAGWAADSIVNWVLANHGDEYLGVPRRQGRALVAWIVPPVAVVLGFTLVIIALRQMAKGRAAPPAPRDLSRAEEDKLKEALRELEAEEDVPFI
jgi:cytochrome c-type biogenesis protein CcmH/NrfF